MHDSCNHIDSDLYTITVLRQKARMENQDAIFWIVGQIVCAAAIWGGIRADIRSIHSRLDHIEKSTGEAHMRIDTHLERGHRGL